MRGSNYSDLAGENLVFGKVVAQERWSQGEVRLYLLTYIILTYNIMQ